MCQRNLIFFLKSVDFEECLALFLSAFMALTFVFIGVEFSISIKEQKRSSCTTMLESLCCSLYL